MTLRKQLQEMLGKEGAKPVLAQLTQKVQRDVRGAVGRILVCGTRPVRMMEHE